MQSYAVWYMWYQLKKEAAWTTSLFILKFSSKVVSLAENLLFATFAYVTMIVIFYRYAIMSRKTVHTAITSAFFLFSSVTFMVWNLAAFFEIFIIFFHIYNFHSFVLPPFFLFIIPDFPKLFNVYRIIRIFQYAVTHTGKKL